MKPIQSILETVIYGDDLKAMADFYTGTLGLSPFGNKSELLIKYRISENQVLLIFNPHLSSAPGRVIPAHGAIGPGHLNLIIDPEDFDAWLDHLRTHNVEIEHIQTWDNGGKSIYFRDPADNSVEMMDSDIWQDRPE